MMFQELTVAFFELLIQDMRGKALTQGFRVDKHNEAKDFL